MSVCLLYVCLSVYVYVTRTFEQHGMMTKLGCVGGEKFGDVEGDRSGIARGEERVRFGHEGERGEGGTS